ncbi:MAG: polysaccharide biosynthesis/export family protein [Stellaceae bacterium]
MARRAHWGVLFAILGAGALAGCDQIPTSGPHLGEIVDEAQMAQRYGFVLVNVDTDVLHAITLAPHSTLRQYFPDDRPVVPRIGPGDVLSITIFESGTGELFAPPSAQQLPYGTASVTLPPVTVDPRGVFTMPFAGTINASGKTPSELQAQIRRRLSGRAIQPQVLVAVSADKTNVVTVTGAVRNPGRFTVSPASETLMQIIAAAGGSTGLASDTVLQLTRDGKQIGIRLSDLLSFPQQDIHAKPGDYINLLQDPRFFLIYGAVYKSGAYPLPIDKITLAQAISSAGGMIDAMADSRGVLVFRYEFPQVMRDIPPARIVSAPTAANGGVPPSAPVIYRIDMKTAAGIFYAQSFRLHDKDLVYVPSAPTVDWEKYLDLFRLTGGPVISGTTSAIEINRGF